MEYIWERQSGGGNQISGSNLDVLVRANSTTLSANRICSGRAAGVELVCFAANLGGNLMNDAPVGVDAAPAPAAIGANTFANTPTTIVPGACAVAAAALRTSRVMTTTRANANVIVREQ